MRQSLAAALILCPILAFAQPKVDFDSGPQSAPVLKEAKASAANVPAAGAQTARRGSKTLWVSLDPADAAALRASGVPIGAAISRSERAAIYTLSSEGLFDAANVMHEKF